MRVVSFARADESASRALPALGASEVWSSIGLTAGTLLVQQTAVDVLRATSVEVGILGAMMRLPYSILAPLAGHLADHYPRKRAVLVCTALRGMLLVVAAAAFALNRGSFWLVAFLAFSVAALTVQHDVSLSALVPDVVAPERLIRGNSLLEVLRSVATLVASAAAGAAMAHGWTFAALALCGVAYLLSAAQLSAVPEGSATLQPGALTLPRVLKEALRTAGELFRDPRLRAVIILTLYNSFWLSAVFALMFLRLRRDLGIGAGAIGIVYACSTLGSVLGSLIAAPLGERASIRAVVIGSTLLTAASCCILGLTPVPALRAPFAACGLALLNVAGAIYNVNVVSYRQKLVPRDFQGRAVGAIRFVTWGALPLGPLIAGAVAGIYGTAIVMEAAAGSIALLAFAVGLSGALASSDRIPSPAFKAS